RHRTANLDLFQAKFLDPPRDRVGDHLTVANDHFVSDRVHDVGPAHAAANRVRQPDFDLLATVDDALGDALRGVAVFHRDDDVLRHVGQFAGQVTRVGRLQSGVGQTLTSTVRRAEVLE